MLLPTVIRTNPFPYSEALHDASLSAFRADCPKSVMIRIYLCFIIVLNLYVSCFLVHKSRSTLSSFTLRESPQRDPEQKKKSTKFDRVIEDFIGKRYGAGEAFYGKRLSDLDDDTYQEMQDLKKPKSYDEKPPRDNAVELPINF